MAVKETNNYADKSYSNTKLSELLQTIFIDNLYVAFCPKKQQFIKTMKYSSVYCMYYVHALRVNLSNSIRRV